MKTLRELQDAFNGLSPTEKEEFMEWIRRWPSEVRESASAYGAAVRPSQSHEAFISHLARIPGVRGGKVIVKGTRIGVHDVISLIANGASIDEIRRDFPELTRAQIYECLAYYEDHRAEIDALVAEQMRGGLSNNINFA